MTADREQGSYEVFVDDNFHYQDESERYRYGEFDTCEAAVEACKKIVDRELSHLFAEHGTAAELYSSYTSFGEDPFIRPAPGKNRFSAREYARQRCEEIYRADR